MMKVMLLAAGRGERMRPLTDRRPKPLLEIGGQTLIEHNIIALAAAGFSELVINHGHLGEQIPAYLGDGNRYNVRIQYSPEPPEALDTGGGIYQALSHSLLDDTPFAIVNADVWSDYPFATLHHIGCASNWPAGQLAHLVLVDPPPQAAHGDFTLSADGQLHNHGTNALTYSGISVLHPELFAGLGSAPERFSVVPLLRAACDAGQINGEHHRGVWHDIGTPQRLRALADLLATKNSEDSH